MSAAVDTHPKTLGRIPNYAKRDWIITESDEDGVWERGVIERHERFDSSLERLNVKVVERSLDNSNDGSDGGDGRGGDVGGGQGVSIGGM